MWTIEALGLLSQQTAYVSDGLPVVGAARGGKGADASQRLMISPGGYIDIVDCGPQSGGPAPSALEIGGQTYWYDAEAMLGMTVQADGQVTVMGDGNLLNLWLAPFPQPDEGDLALVLQMASVNLIPYPVVPDGHRPFGAVAQIAENYFPWSSDAASLGLAIYDWTTADFFRMDIFNYYQYTTLEGVHLDKDDIVNAISTSKWGTYKPSDPAFMGSMMMKPATNRDQITAQYEEVADELKALLDGLKSLTTTALAAMPRVSTLSYPALYSGQVDVANLGENAFVTYFLEYPGNAGPPPAHMGQPLDQALAGFMAPGSIVTLKNFMSTTSCREGAEKYANGILLEITQDKGVLWQDCAYVTPLSDEAGKDEYLFAPGTRFRLGQSSQQTDTDGKTTLVLPMTAVTA